VFAQPPKATSAIHQGPSPRRTDQRNIIKALGEDKMFTPVELAEMEMEIII